MQRDGPTSTRLFAASALPHGSLTLRLDGDYVTSPLAPVERLRRSRCTSVEHLPAHSLFQRKHIALQAALLLRSDKFDQYRSYLRTFVFL